MDHAQNPKVKKTPDIGCLQGGWSLIMRQCQILLSTSLTAVLTSGK